MAKVEKIKWVRRTCIHFYLLSSFWIEYCHKDDTCLVLVSLVNIFLIIFNKFKLKIVLIFQLPLFGLCSKCVMFSPFQKPVLELLLFLSESFVKLLSFLLVSLSLNVQISGNIYFYHLKWRSDWHSFLVLFENILKTSQVLFVCLFY